VSFWHHLLCKIGIHEWVEWEELFRFCVVCGKTQRWIRRKVVFRFGLPYAPHYIVENIWMWEDIEKD